MCQSKQEIEDYLLALKDVKKYLADERRKVEKELIESRKRLVCTKKFTYSYSIPPTDENVNNIISLLRGVKP